MKKISIIVPFYNEEKSINSFFDELSKYLNSPNKYSFEVICVNDGSKDKTLELLTQKMKKHKEITVISFSKNYGHEAAVNAGINNCTGDAAIIMDADLQDPPSHIPELLNKWESGYDVVNVKRIDRKSDSLFKRATAKIFYKIISKWSYKIKIEENVNNFRLISRRVINVVKSLSEKNKVFRFEIPFAGFKTTYIELVRPERVGGKSHYNLKSMTKLAIDSVISTSTEPLNLITKMFIIMLLLFISSVITEIVLYTITATTKVLNIPSPVYILWLLINITSLFLLFIIFSIAIMAQYIARIHIETQNRPMYVIEKIYKNNK